MAEGDVVLYTDITEQLAMQSIDFESDVLKISLHTGYTPDQDADQVWADVSATEYGTASGYTAGGATLANVAVVQDDGNNKSNIDFDDVTWTSLGALTPATPSHAIIRNTTVDHLIGYFILGTTATDGNDYTIAPHASGFVDIALA